MDRLPCSCIFGGLYLPRKMSRSQLQRKRRYTCRIAGPHSGPVLHKFAPDMQSFPDTTLPITNNKFPRNYEAYEELMSFPLDDGRSAASSKRRSLHRAVTTFEVPIRIWRTTPPASSKKVTAVRMAEGIEEPHGSAPRSKM